METKVLKVAEVNNFPKTLHLPLRPFICSEIFRTIKDLIKGMFGL